MKAALVVLFALVAVSAASVVPISVAGIPGLTVAGVSPVVVSQGIIQTVPAIQVVAVPAQAVSVTANRGAVHVAPLPGHAVSSSQLNLEAAPGTV